MKLKRLLITLAFCGVATTGVTLPASVAASTYEVVQCSASQNSHEAAQEGGSTGVRLDSTCGLGGPQYLQAGTNGAGSPGGFKQWAFTAPNGTQMNNVTGDYGIQSQTGSNGHQAYMFARRLGQADQIVAASVPNSGGGFNSSFNLQSSGHAPLDRVGVGVTCTNSLTQGNCADRTGIYARLGELRFYMEDTVPPAQPQTSNTLVSGGWRTGNAALTINGSDMGAGVAATSTVVNGQLVDFAFPCSPNASKLKPCPSTGGDDGFFNVATAPFTQGDNVLRTCVGEAGNNPAVTCKNEIVRVDTVAPGAVSSLAVDGGDGWKRDRDDFDLLWSNPSQGAGTAPIAGASLRITGPNAYNNTTYHAGNDRTSIDDVAVPNVPGEYTATVFLRDAAGNESPASAPSVHLRFDDTVPVGSAPEIANGWINRTEVAAGYTQEWTKPLGPDVPPSGIAGYRVVVNANSDTDPCSGATDQRACGAPITEIGIDNNSRLLGVNALSEGGNYVHVVAISGSGMRATDVGHTPIKVDTVDPAILLARGGNDEWINHDADLLAVASDATSGMQDTDEFPDDDPPATFLEVDGQLISEPDANVERLVDAEGSHQVRYWARDLAGNTSTGNPGLATVRIDKSQPSVAFTDSQDPDDPDKLVAPVRDTLSGVVDGGIAYREFGGAEWKGLDTVVQNEQLVARVDSGDLRKGVTYEFRAIASDRAGNTRTSMTKANGEPMRVTGPFRAVTRVVDLEVNDKAAARTGYGKKAKVSGDLVTDEGGSAVPNAVLEINETFAPGSKLKTRTWAVTTNAQGEFSAALRRGPSRTVTAFYRGDRRYLGTSSAPAKLRVRSKITLKVSSQAREDETIAFKGELKAKGAKLTRRGKRVEVQVRIGKKWKAVGRSFRTNKKGVYRLPYTFTADYTEPITYQFRAVKLREADFPFLPSKSKIRNVTVFP